MAWGRTLYAKYGNKKISHAGFSFASKLEAKLYDILFLMKAAGELTDIKVQDHVYLTNARILYIVDFKVTLSKTHEEQWYESKGFETSDWKIKKRLWKHYGPGKLNIYKGTTKAIWLAETVEVK